ncbi:hypothetical protein cypCar_00036293 [Cyprinus carpio]|nr:hypothetical protein cypCar_00036293 [Cyprinus carpio]
MEETVMNLGLAKTEPGVFGADEVKSVMEGESVTLNITVTEIKDINMIMWKSNKSLIAKISRAFSKITVYDNDTEEGFRDRLKLDNQTGSLTITYTRTTDSGDYEVTIISSSKTTTYTFRVTVFGESQLHFHLCCQSSKE